MTTVALWPPTALLRKQQVLKVFFSMRSKIIY